MNDDTLILYYYGDGLRDDEMAAVESALANDASVRERYAELRRSLERFGEFPAERAPAEAAARWHRSLSRAAAAERTDSDRHGKGWHFPSFAWGALAAALVAVLGVGLYLDMRPPPGSSIAGEGDIDAPVALAATPASFTRGLEVHLRQTRQDIARLTPDDDEDRARLISDIVRQNRLFERTAREHDAEDVARVLRAFEPVLLRLAGGDVDEQDAAAVRAKLEFELDVVLTKMQQRDSHQAELI